MRMDTRNFVSLEGIDFTWKTPFSQWLHRDLTAQGSKVIVTRDPPYYISPWDEYIEIFERGDSLDKLSEAFLLLTARIDNYQRTIAPALREGQIVIADRYSDSWLAYQSLRLAKYFEDDPQKALEFLIVTQDNLNSRRLLGFPGLTIWISDDPNVTIRRAATADKISKYENLPLQIQVDKQYQVLAARFPRIHAVNARGLDIHSTYIQVLNIVTEYFGQ